MAEELTTPGPWKVVEHKHSGGDLWLSVNSATKGPGGWEWIAEIKYLATAEDRQRANARLIATGPDLLALARIIGSSYPNDPGTSDLDDEQTVTITLGTVRKAWAALAKVDR